MRNLTLSLDVVLVRVRFGDLNVFQCDKLYEQAHREYPRVGLVVDGIAHP